jgi:hypothetical protein
MRVRMAAQREGQEKLAGLLKNSLSLDSAAFAASVRAGKQEGTLRDED